MKILALNFHRLFLLPIARGYLTDYRRSERSF